VGGADTDPAHSYAVRFNDTGAPGFAPPPTGPTTTASASPSAARSGAAAPPPSLATYELYPTTFQVQRGPLITYAGMSSLETDGPLSSAGIWHVYGTSPHTDVTIRTGAGFGLPTGNLIDIIPTGKDLSLIHKVTIVPLTVGDPPMPVMGPPATVAVINDQADMTYVASDSSLTSSAFPEFDLEYADVEFLKIVNDADPADSIVLDDLAMFVLVTLVTNASR
jgi:hypothetical protein